MAELARVSALNGAHWHGEGLACAEVPHSAKFLLRGPLDDGVARRLEALLGCSLPGTVGPVVGDDPAVTLPAPNRWLVLAEALSAAPLAPRLAAALQESGLALSDLSDGLVEIAIDGTRAADLLASATPLDLRLPNFPPASLAQTQFARTSCMIRRRSATRFGLFVDRSYASYAWSWLLKHARLATALG